MSDSSQEKHKSKMQKYKKHVDNSIAKATTDRGVIILLTGNGKGKSSSAFGMVMRSLGYDHQVAIIQFIKGKHKTGEELYIAKHHPDIFFHQMKTGFTWDTQDKENDIIAAKKTWTEAKKALSNPQINLVLLDELTYMLTYHYLDAEDIITTLQNRPPQQTVVITGRAAGSSLKKISDTISEIKEEKHAFHNGIMAREGIDY